jgi:hypothetical protein
MATIKPIKPLEDYVKMLDTDLISRATAVLTGLTGNTNYANPPIDLATFKSNIDRFSALVSESADGSKKVKAEKKKQRVVVIRDLKLLGRYVEVTCKDDMATFKSSGFPPASNVKAPPQPLPTPSIKKVDHGATSGQLLVQGKAVRGAKAYDVRFAAITGTTPPATWTVAPLPNVKVPFAVNGLTPGTTYAFQVRARGPLGYTDWSDSVTFMCT